LPERFDPKDPLFLTPNGEQREEGAFKPFSFGPRKCLGYIWANLVVPTLITNMLNKYEFEHTDAKNSEPNFFPLATVFMNHSPPIPMKIRKVN